MFGMVSVRGDFHPQDGVHAGCTRSAASPLHARFVDVTRISLRWVRPLYRLVGWHRRYDETIAQVRLAPGYLRSSTSGRATAPVPAARSRSGISRTAARCVRSGSSSRAGSMVTVLATLSIANPQLVTVEVQVLHAKARALEHAQPGSVEQRAHQTGHSFHLFKHRLHFVARQDHRQSVGTLGVHHARQPVQLTVEHPFVQK
jgi:hypothetical protein